MTRPRLLDLFCGAGGAAVGYHRAGFDVLGVDIKPQPNYPFDFVQGNALDLRLILRDYDVIHASPPCQRYIRGGLVDRNRHPDLLGTTRELLQASGRPWVIENVPGAPMRADLILCGSMFGLKVRRHRWFEFGSPFLALTPSCDHSKPVTGVYGNPHGAAGAWPGMLPSDFETWSDAMGIDWMVTSELADAIPPAYTEFVGSALLRADERCIMSRGLECDVCWLAACDLPDEIDPELFFETDDGVTHCPTCDPADAGKQPWEW